MLISYKANILWIEYSSDNIQETIDLMDEWLDTLDEIANTLRETKIITGSIEIGIMIREWEAVFKCHKENLYIYNMLEVSADENL